MVVEMLRCMMVVKVGMVVWRSYLQLTVGMRPAHSSNAAIMKEQHSRVSESKSSK